MKEYQTKFLMEITLTLINLMLAFAVTGLVIQLIGENPLDALYVLWQGAFGYEGGLGSTLFYATNYVFTGLAFMFAFHVRLFNIGAEGQAAVGGLGLTLAILALDNLSTWLVLPIAFISSVLFGGIWGLIPGWLQVKRGSHIVITTIMFNFIASAGMVYFLTGPLIENKQMNPQTRIFLPNAWIPKFSELSSAFDVSPFNLTSVLAIILAILLWYFFWHTRWGYEFRVIGENETAAQYAGIQVSQKLIIAMFVSGALASFVGINVILGNQRQLLLEFQAGYGFAGVAVALIGRNHPFGIVLAALLFGILQQGGSELAFEMEKVDAHVVILVQGLVILFAGALENLFKPQIQATFQKIFTSKTEN